MPNFKTPDTQDSAATWQSPGGNPDTPGSVATSPLAAKTMQRQGPYQGTTLGPVPQSGSLLGVGQTGVVRMSPRKFSAQQGTGSSSGMAGAAGSAVSRPWLDKLVDQLVGDVGSDEDKYALICRHCYAHNGLVLEEEIEDIQYACPKCGNFNPSVRALRARSQDEMLQRKRPIARQSDSFLESARARIDTSGDESEYGSASGSDSEDEKNKPLEPEAQNSNGDNDNSDDEKKEGEEERSSRSGMEEGVDDDETPRTPLLASLKQDTVTDDIMLRTPTPKPKTKNITISENITTRKRRNKNKRT
ncbi:hypothetical protein IW138_004714 [Coemansia sp. RSA 986]|nr:hypothetical protein IW138_004714 [Coemansia sp. RSA 986]